MKTTFPLSALPVLNHLPKRRKTKERRRAMLIYICPVPERIKTADGLTQEVIACLGAGWERN